MIDPETAADILRGNFKPDIIIISSYIYDRYVEKQDSSDLEHLYKGLIETNLSDYMLVDEIKPRSVISVNDLLIGFANSPTILSFNPIVVANSFSESIKAFSNFHCVNGPQIKIFQSKM